MQAAIQTIQYGNSANRVQNVYAYTRPSEVSVCTSVFVNSQNWLYMRTGLEDGSERSLFYRYVFFLAL
jgi:hypothetical protein